jgi:hypothetical protein
MDFNAVDDPWAACDEGGLDAIDKIALVGGIGGEA